MSADIAKCESVGRGSDRRRTARCNPVVLLLKARRLRNPHGYPLL